MSGNLKSIVGVVLGTLLSFPAFGAADAPFSASDRAATVQTLVTKLNANYITPAVAKRVGTAIAKKNAAGGYASVTTAKAFSEVLATDLRELSGDLHFGARIDETFRDASSSDVKPTRAEWDDYRDQVARDGFGFQKIERLPGNVGYIELRRFDASEIVGPAYSSAISLLSGTDALILDLRRNGGGSPTSVAYLMSHFFPLGEIRHLSDVYDPSTKTTEQYRTVAAVAQRYDKPVYVLTSNRTFSAGEDCAYSFQTQKRGIVVGEKTGGGSNPVGWFGLGNGIIVAIPRMSVINPVTKTNWEHVGVKPDIAVPPEQALQTAHVAILRNLVSSAKDDKQRTELQRLLALAEKGESDKPVYKLRAGG